jgi:hypothetical protein
MRARIVDRLTVLGIHEIVDDDVRDDAILSGPQLRPAVLRVAAREDVVIALAVRDVLETG